MRVQIENESSHNKIECRVREWDESCPWGSRFRDQDESLAEVCWVNIMQMHELAEEWSGENIFQLRGQLFVVSTNQLFFTKQVKPGFTNYLPRGLAQKIESFNQKFWKLKKHLQNYSKMSKISEKCGQF